MTSSVQMPTKREHSKVRETRERMEPMSASTDASATSPTKASTLRGSTGLLSVVLLASVLQMAPRLWGAWGGWFFADDFWRQDVVTRRSIWDIATTGQGGHVEPLTYLVLHAFTSITLFDWPAQVAAAAILWLVTDIVVLLVFRELWGWGWPTAMAYGAYAISPFTAPSFLWSSQVWLGAAAVLALALMLLTTIRASRVPSRSRILIGLGTLVIALLMTERSAVEAVCVGIFACVTFSGQVGGIGPFLGRMRVFYAGGVLVLGAYAISYLHVTRGTLADPLLTVRPTTDNVVVNAIEGFGQSVAPTLLGGPWFLEGTGVGTFANVPSIAVLLSIEVLFALVIAIMLMRRTRQTWAALALLGVVIAVSLIMIAVARGGSVGALAMRDWRYYPGLSVWGPLLVTLALVPPANRVTGPWPARLPDRPLRSFATHPVVWGVVGLALVNGAVMTSYFAAEEFRGNPAQPFLERTLSDLKRLGPVVLVDRQLPGDVVPPILTSQTLASRVLSAASPRPLFDTPTERLYAIDDSGAVLPANVTAGPSTPPGPDGSCGTAVQPGWTRRLSLGQGLFNWTWWARIDYLAQSDSTLRLKAGDSLVTVPVHKGPGSVFAPVSGAVDNIYVSAPADHGGVCIAGIRVGTATVVPQVPSG